MNDLQIANEIIVSAVKDSSYVTVLISSCVFIIYTIIIKIVDVIKSKNRHKPLIQMADAVKEIGENVVKLNLVLSKTIQESETKEFNRINQLINICFNSFQASVMNRCFNVIIHNNIEKNRENIKEMIYKTISTEYYKIYSTFSNYEHDSINIATKLQEQWIDDITNECIRIIYTDQDALTRIRQVNEKLTILADEYSIYIKNKIFNY
jgi:uncharacterized protein with PQ loop repeat